jgi:hypothetical protein
MKESRRRKGIVLSAAKMHTRKPKQFIPGRQYLETITLHYCSAVGLMDVRWWCVCFSGQIDPMLLAKTWNEQKRGEARIKSGYRHMMASSVYTPPTQSVGYYRWSIFWEQDDGSGRKILADCDGRKTWRIARVVEKCVALLAIYCMYVGNAPTMGCLHRNMYYEQQVAGVCLIDTCRI